MERQDDIYACHVRLLAAPSGHRTKTEAEVDGKGSGSREATSSAVMSALKAGSRDRCFNPERGKEGWRDGEDSCKSWRHKDASK